jgi:hypothetical protein
MSDSPDRLAERLRAEGEKTLEFFRVLDPQRFDLTVYSEGSCWSIKQILAHFLSTEIAIKQLMEYILHGGPGVSQDFDIDAYNERRVAILNGTAVDQLLNQFEIQRQSSVEFVAGLEDEDLLKTGRHPFLGIAPLEEIIKLLYRHNQIHQRDIRRALSAEGG